MLGQEVKTLVNSEFSAGTFNVVWRGLDNNGNKVSSGTYIYRVFSEQNVITKKMLFLK
jgi:flagellar hook assembly protein FlgD